MEVGLMTAAKFGVINILRPTYSMNPHENFFPIRSHIYGHQHLPNSTYKIKKNCFETSYKFNTLGFRDQLEAKTTEKSRVLVIGDSFMEGVGVNEDKRFSDLLEKASKLPHLNFAMGDKGTTQAFLIYDSIAKTYQHNAILWGIFPTNDFIDDDPNFGKNIDGIKPCWSGTYPNYELKFFPEEAPSKKTSSTIKRFLKSYTYTYNAIFYLKETIKLILVKEHQIPKTGYFNYTEEQLKRMQYSIERLRLSANDKSITILCIPSANDLKAKEKKQQNIEIVLRDICSNLDIEFIGLYELFAAQDQLKNDFYYQCDSHWNPDGHRIVKDYLLQNSTLYN